MKKIPYWLQPILWSVDVTDLDLEKNKAYIINQILAYGGFEELKTFLKLKPLAKIGGALAGGTTDLLWRYCRF